jgi:hypothetical protein
MYRISCELIDFLPIRFLCVQSSKRLIHCLGKSSPEMSLARDSIWQQPPLMGGMNKNEQISPRQLFFKGT